MFDRFWETYPRKVARKAAEKAWSKIPAQYQIDVVTALRKHLTLWKQQGTEKSFIPYPATWLNGARWEDEIELAPEMPQCDWNRNGNRGPETRCSRQAVKEDDKNFYCAEHCQKLGLKFLKVA